MAEDDLVSKMRKKYQDMQEGLKRDIRPMMSRAMGYNPEADMYRDPHDFEYKEYPKWVKKGDTIRHRAEPRGRKPTPRQEA